MRLRCSACSGNPGARQAALYLPFDALDVSGSSLVPCDSQEMGVIYQKTLVHAEGRA